MVEHEVALKELSDLISKSLALADEVGLSLVAIRLAEAMDVLALQAGPSCPTKVN